MRTIEEILATPTVEDMPILIAHADALPGIEGVGLICTLVNRTPWPVAKELLASKAFSDWALRHKEEILDHPTPQLNAMIAEIQAREKR